MVTKIQKMKNTQRQSVVVNLHMSQRVKQRRRKRRIGLLKSSGRLQQLSPQQPLEQQRFFRPTINLPPNYVSNGYTAPALPLSRLATERTNEEAVAEIPIEPIKIKPKNPVNPFGIASKERRDELKMLKPFRGSYPRSNVAIDAIMENIRNGTYVATQTERLNELRMRSIPSGLKYDNEDIM